MQHLLPIFILFVLGACFWSFWSVLLTRLHDGISRSKIRGILFWYSQCPVCKHRLDAMTLIPILSFFMFGKKCKYCKSPISAMYAILEILSGLVFVGTYWMVYMWFGEVIVLEMQIVHLVFRLVVNRMFVLLLVHDMYHRELHVPMRFLLLCVVLAAPLWWMIAWFWRIVFSSALFGGVFYALWYGAKLYVWLKYKKKEEGIGEGDAMFAFVIGALMPIVMQYRFIPFDVAHLSLLLICFIIFSCVIGLVYALVLQYSGLFPTNTKRQLNRIPFIPCMIVSLWILLLWANFFMSVWAM